MDTATKALQIAREALVQQGFIVLAHDPLHLINDETGEEITLTIDIAQNSPRVVDQHEVDEPVSLLTGRTVVSADIEGGWLNLRLDNGRTLTVSAEHGASLVFDHGWTQV